MGTTTSWVLVALLPPMSCVGKLLQLCGLKKTSMLLAAIKADSLSNWIPNYKSDAPTHVE